jgi:hypothetical protein
MHKGMGRAIAALNHFGLTEESGSKDNRRIRLTDLSQNIIHLPDEDEKKISSLKKAALMPTIHQVLWERYQSTLPGDAIIKSFLIRDKSYNEVATLDVIKNYRESFDIAKLGDLIGLNPSAPTMSMRLNHRYPKRVQSLPLQYLKYRTPRQFS